MESEDSGISEAEAKEFSSGEATQKEESEEEEDSDDLVSSTFNYFMAGKIHSSAHHDECLMLQDE